MGLTFRTGALVDAIYTDSSNKVGIGTSTLTAGIPLSINVTTGNNCNVAFQENASDKWYLRNITSSNAFSFYSVSGSTEVMRLSSSGNVGIGATPTDFGSSYTVLDVYNGTVGGYLLARSPNVTGQISVDNNTAMYVQTRTNHPIVFALNNSEKMRITSSGQFFVGTTTAIFNTLVNINYNQSNYEGLAISTDKAYNGSPQPNLIFGGKYNSAGSYRQYATIQSYKDNTTDGDSSASLVFYTNGNSASVTERMRITSGGYTKMSNTGTYVSATGNYHEMRTSQTDEWTTFIQNTAASPYGVTIRYPSASPNGGGNEILYTADSTGQRATIRSNGGIANYQSNNVNLSDIRTKKDIIPLESYWDKFKAIEIVKFKYKDQSHDDFNIGVIAQQVEKVAPEFVDIDGWDSKLDVQNEEPLKSIYTEDLHHATIKVLQEAMAKIEELEAKVTALENR